MRSSIDSSCKRIAAFVALVSVFSYSIAADDFPPKRNQTEVVDFPALGKIRIDGVILRHQLPEVVFTNLGSGKELLRSSVGADFLDPKHIDPTNPKADPYPIVRLKLLAVSGLKSPLVLVAAMEAGGSDCRYGGQLFGVVKGQIAAVSPPLPRVWFEGGYAIRRSTSGSALELLAWDGNWESTKTRSGGHDYWVRIYRFNELLATFELTRTYKAPGPATEANLLREIPDFGC
jgi:hypothetical protein